MQEKNREKIFFSRTVEVIQILDINEKERVETHDHLCSTKKVLEMNIVEDGNFPRQ